ncbi:MAG TPA: TetR/AcrR family transcriptional regulator [Geminicoccus sp.]|uniref:TetR/AcrR family transcriptional regulator n=1 Tax=Geminicoccus sp. TaxID=2024832 RepID=UPI002E35CD53|nr:TetR/AcrR family transcriptional regulator [Geminicoccus sp.]HEX2525060.1 TetR/AcrR family transcriptional regulator [Geminicoccus sp.]
MLLFWRQGYAATSVAELTAAMGINPPSLYAAFGDKERLFLEAVESYQHKASQAAARLLAEAPTAKLAIERLLEAMAQHLTCPDHPSGCMVVTAAMNCSSDCSHLQHALAERRAAGTRRLRERIEQGIRDGELPAEVDAAGLASFYDTVMQGMTIQAKDGANREQLLATTRTAMRAWPSVDR